LVGLAIDELEAILGDAVVDLEVEGHACNIATVHRGDVERGRGLVVDDVAIRDRGAPRQEAYGGSTFLEVLVQTLVVDTLLGGTQMVGIAVGEVALVGEAVALGPDCDGISK